MPHPTTTAVYRWLRPNPNLPEGGPQAVAIACSHLADGVLEHCAEGPELTAGLRKLLEAKDCFVRAAIDQLNQDEDGIL
ncbi:hypothetical protein GCM10023403_10340 [Pseudonocardia benzenivorans]|uniref:hypothetical protein n=1 Tax=Pseudonocardia benzenivorans TaxID=228005 RepID=UPI0031F941E4